MTFASCGFAPYGCSLTGRQEVRTQSRVVSTYRLRDRPLLNVFFSRRPSSKRPLPGPNRAKPQLVRPFFAEPLNAALLSCREVTNRTFATRFPHLMGVLRQDKSSSYLSTGGCAYRSRDRTSSMTVADHPLSLAATCKARCVPDV